MAMGALTTVLTNINRLIPVREEGAKKPERHTRQDEMNIIFSFSKHKISAELRSR